MNQTKVVAISGTSGCGKTTIVKLLADTFNCPRLHFDDYVDGNTYPRDMKKWLEEGADLSAMKTPKLVSAVRQLFLKSNLERGSSDFIFIEEPFGKQRSAMSPWIDYVILLDQPMEICLARVVHRNMTNPLADPLSSLPQYLTHYEDHYRDCYIAAVNQVRDNCHLLIKDILSVQETTHLIRHWLMNKMTTSDD